MERRGASSSSTILIVMLFHCYDISGNTLRLQPCIIPQLHRSTNIALRHADYPSYRKGVGRYKTTVQYIHEVYVNSGSKRSAFLIIR